MSDLPKRVEFHEEGPREGFQIEPRVYPLEQRAALVEALAETGLKAVQVASFVSPKAVPQMTDSEALFAAIRRRPGVRYEAVWLNEQGFERARATPGVDLAGKISLYASDAFARRNNNCSAEEMRGRVLRWLDLYAEAGLKVERALVMAAFGCNFEGEIPPARAVDELVWAHRTCAERGIVLPKVYLADTMGWANPQSVRRLVGMLREALPATRIGLHLHDTRGLGAANVLAALEMGVDLFDSSIAGLGGCPFAGHGDSRGAGNICTEDMVFLCHEMGIETGLDLEKLIEAARLAERIIGRPLGGHVMHAGSLAKYRARAGAAAGHG
ncbi:hydroxymethylglutaryl-CoA lyase [Belnapia rosea]|uniref:Hydroxymethylglutaryl-CoA lyase n=1 Tax=Belnapia rosea TaxID=938405 RepID=A0A1G7AYR1_9PROT|nr:hydroxymethylglutaryl-CoA lyase [Belnapia rosea]SDB74981.1 hydroxymethylglutaryl-CoA lyase [Belnapia rosea]SDE20028.1 hydroxymethylglutaryl-CoA lyase [Belnapia rosea]